VRIALDTNVLARLVLGDEPAQSEAAAREVDDAEAVVLPTHALCELVWVLGARYRRPRAEVLAPVRAVVGLPNAVFDRGAVDAGLAVLAAGGDFADGVIAHEGARLGAEALATFDRRAARLLAERGVRTRDITVPPAA